MNYPKVEATLYPLDVRVRVAGPQTEPLYNPDDDWPFNDWVVMVKVTSRARIGKRVLHTSTSDKHHFAAEPTIFALHKAARFLVGLAHNRLLDQYGEAPGVAPEVQWDANWDFPTSLDGET